MTARRTKPAETSRRDYLARAAGWIAGRRVAKGERLSLSEAEARFENVTPAPKARRKPRSKT